MCQLTIVPSADHQDQDWGLQLIPASPDAKTPTSPPAEKPKRNVFNVSDTRAVEKRAAVRSDVDMRRQQRIIKNHRRKANEKAVAQDWTETCASRQDHAKFIKILLGESHRYQLRVRAEAGAAAADLAMPQTELYLKRTMERMDRSQTDQYVTCLEMISGKRLFDVPPQLTVALTSTA